jgi:hypothetical protein
MSARLVIGLLALVGVSISGIRSTIVHLEMVSRVNAMLPKERQFAELGWHLPKTQRLHREYRALFPGGDLLRKWRTTVATGLLSLLICAWSLGFFPY